MVKSRNRRLIRFWLGEVAHTFNSSTGKAEAGIADKVSSRVIQRNPS